MKNWSVLAAGSVGLLIGFAGVYWVWSQRGEEPGRTAPAAAPADAAAPVVAAPAPITSSTPPQAAAAQSTPAPAAKAPAAASTLAKNAAPTEDHSGHDHAQDAVAKKPTPSSATDHEDHSGHDHAQPAAAKTAANAAATGERYEGGIERLETGYDLSAVDVQQSPEAQALQKGAAQVPGAGTSKDAEWSGLLPPGESKAQKGKIEMASGEQTFDFGKLRQGDMGEHSFEFVSNGEEPLVISGVKPSCGCTKAEVMLLGADGAKTVYTKGDPIAVGQRFTLDSQINTDGKSGAFSAQISLYANDPRGSYNLRLVAEIQPILVVTPSPSIFFGKVTSAERVEQSVTVTAADGLRFQLEPSMETVVEPLDVEVRAIEPDQEGKAAEWQIKVGFGPDAPIGLRNYPLRLQTDIPVLHPKYPSQDGSVQTHAVQLQVQAQVSGMVSAEPAFLTFGMVRPNEPVERTVRVESHDDFRIPADLPVVIEGLQGQEFPYGDAFTTSVQLVEEGRMADVKVKLDGLPADLNGSFGGIIKLKVGHPHMEEVVLRFSGVCRPAVPVANPTGGN